MVHFWMVWFWMVETIAVAIAKAVWFENWTIWNPTFKKSGLQMFPDLEWWDFRSLLYSPYKKIVYKLFAVQITIRLLDYFWPFEYQTSPVFKSPLYVLLIILEMELVLAPVFREPCSRFRYQFKPQLSMCLCLTHYAVVPLGATCGCERAGGVRVRPLVRRWRHHVSWATKETIFIRWLARTTS